MLFYCNLLYVLVQNGCFTPFPLFKGMIMNTAAILKALKYCFLCSNRTELKCSYVFMDALTNHDDWKTRGLISSSLYCSTHEIIIMSNSGESRRGVCQGVHHDGMNEVLRVIVVENISVYRSQPKCFGVTHPLNLYSFQKKKLKKRLPLHAQTG